MGWLDEQRVLVTGGGSGLGRAVVARFVEEGARVGVLELDATKAADLRAAFGDRVVTTVGDATSYADNEAAVADTVRAFGGLDVFVGNAGVWDYNRSLESLAPEELDGAFDEVFGLNVKGYLLGARAALAELRRTGGSMLFTVSNAGFRPAGGGPLYTASKHAVVGLITQLAYELAPTVRVNGVAVGAMSTDLRGPRSLGLEGVPISQLPMGAVSKVFTAVERPIDPAEYTGHYVLLASRRDGSTATGAVHVCDGGVAVRGRQQLDDAFARAFAAEE